VPIADREERTSGDLSFREIRVKEGRPFIDKWDVFHFFTALEIIFAHANVEEEEEVALGQKIPGQKSNKLSNGEYVFVLQHRALFCVAKRP
jgi:hypothetical protein